MENNNNQWIRGPKTRKQTVSPWQITDAMIQKQKLQSPYIHTSGQSILQKNIQNEPLDFPQQENNLISETSIILEQKKPIKPYITEDKAVSSFEYYEGLMMEEKEKESAKEIVPAGTIRGYLEKMICYSPSRELTELMIKELEPLGEVLIKECQEFKTGIIIFENYKNLTEIKIDNQYAFPPGSKVRDGRGWEVVRGAYSSHHRMMFMAEELITGYPGGVSTHEFGHAYDHAWMINNQMDYGFSVFLWNKFHNQRTFISEYASTQPKEYFAVSLEYYFNSEKKELLKKCDPGMYGFISNLIAGVHKKPKTRLSD